VRDVLKTISALPPQVFSGPARIAVGIRTALETPISRAVSHWARQPLDMQAASNAQPADLDAWSNVTATAGERHPAYSVAQQPEPFSMMSPASRGSVRLSGPDQHDPLLINPAYFAESGAASR